MNEFNDVRMFQLKFSQLVHGKPGLLTKRKVKERVEFLFEELHEFTTSCGLYFYADDDGKIKIRENDDGQDIAEQADALVDLVYVALGTAVMMGLPWEQLWNDVHRANMSKERGISHRGHLVDCVKPPGWVGPKTMEILKIWGYNENDKTERDDAVHLS